MDRLVQLRCNLTDDQREMLNTIWQTYRREGRWTPSRALPHQFIGRLQPNDVRAALERLNGSVVWEFRDENQRQCYQLTFLGTLLTDEGEELEELCLRYVEYVRDLYLRDPLADLVTSQEVETALSISVERAQLLGQLLGRGYFCGSLRQGPGPQGWTAVVPEDVATLTTHRDLRVYLRTQAARDYDPAVPIDENGRASYYLGYTRLSSSQWEDLEPKLTVDLPSVGEAEPGRDQLFIDDIDSFEKVKDITTEMVAHLLPGGYLPTPEGEVKRAIEEILNVPFERPHWGGELNDISTANVMVKGRRRNTAFLLKGPGIGRKELTIADCGKNGDQIGRLFSAAHDLFVIQYVGPIADAVARSAEVHARELRGRGKPAQYVIIDGQDTARLLFAYGKLK